MGSGPNRKQIVNALRNTAQSASNMVAENASVPVDVLAWALRKAGVPIGDKPVMGSDWMREKGLTAPVEEGMSKAIGDTIGMVGPMGFSKAGSQAIIEGGKKLKGLPVGMSIKDVSGAYPQSEALALAQQRAALPRSQGGLGLPENNTAMQRAREMGFDTPAYRGTTANEISIKPKTFASENTDVANQYGGYFSKFSDDPKMLDAMMQLTPNGNVMPLLVQDAASARARTNIPDYEMILNPDQARSRFAAFDPFRKTAATAAAMGVAAPDLLAQERNK